MKKMVGLAEIGLIIIVLFIIGIVGIAIFIQRNLSKSENKYLGLILPGISLVFSLLLLFNFVIMEWQDIFQLVTIFIVLNIPTMILFAIYYYERNKIKKIKDIEKMKIEDL